MANIKISELTPKGANLASTDLLEISESAGGGTFVTKSVTGSEIRAGLQETLVSGTNIKTINGSSVLGNGDLTISGGGGLKGLYNVLPPQVGQTVTNRLYGTSTSFNTYSNNVIRLHPYVSSNTITTASISMQVLTSQVGAQGRILIYSNVNSKPSSKLYESATLVFSTSGIKTATIAFTFTAGETYWIGFQNSLSVTSATISSVLSANLFPFLGSPTANSGYIGYETTAYIFGSAPTTMGTVTAIDSAFPLLLLNL